MEMRIGDLRHRLALEEAARVDDGAGGAEETWMLVDELWAALRPISGQERQVADQLAGRVTHEIWVRYRAGVKPEMRFRAGARVFEIRAVIDTSERRRFLKCLAEERDL
ncbi:MAG: phage head closure protein [Hyphomicrobiaceae bacterium]|nr:phage head closure protein [Hyphomicrobiaceae bacterium]